MQILAISGSLRAATTNTTLLKAAAALAPEDVMFNLYAGSWALATRVRVCHRRSELIHSHSCVHIYDSL